MGSDQISFLPLDFQKRRSRFRITLWGGALLSIVMLVFCTALIGSHQSLCAIENRHAEVVYAYAKSLANYEQARRLNEQRQTLLSKARLAAALINGIPRSSVLAAVTSALPAGCSLLNIDLDSRLKPEPAPAILTAFEMKKGMLEAKHRAEINPAFEVPRLNVFVKITGLAASDHALSQIVRELVHSPIFTDVSLAVNEICVPPGDRDSQRRRFQIVMMLATDADLNHKITVTAMSPE